MIVFSERNEVMHPVQEHKTHWRPVARNYIRNLNKCFLTRYGYMFVLFCFVLFCSALFYNYDFKYRLEKVVFQ